MGIFGEIERVAGDLYPYRWPIAAGAVAALAAMLWLAYRQGWHRVLRRHLVATAVLAVVLLAVAIPLANYTLSPLWTRTELQEASPLVAGAEAAGIETEAETGGADANPTARVTATGRFRGADEFHTGEGTAKLIETAPGHYTLRFEEFSVRNGPDLYVYLSPEADGYADGALNLGRLKATDGAFNYEIPAGTDVTQFKSALVWCKQFSVLFASAPLAAS